MEGFWSCLALPPASSLPPIFNSCAANLTAGGDARVGVAELEAFAREAFLRDASLARTHAPNKGVSGLFPKAYWASGDQGPGLPFFTCPWHSSRMVVLHILIPLLAPAAPQRCANSKPPSPHTRTHTRRRSWAAWC